MHAGVHGEIQLGHDCVIALETPATLPQEKLYLIDLYTWMQLVNTPNLTVSRLDQIFSFLMKSIYIHPYKNLASMGVLIVLLWLQICSQEFEFIKSLISSDLSVARTFSNTCRYIFNNPDLQVADSLPLPITKSLKKLQRFMNGKFSTDLYDKRDEFCSYFNV